MQHELVTGCGIELCVWLPRSHTLLSCNGDRFLFPDSPNVGAHSKETFFFGVGCVHRAPYIYCPHTPHVCMNEVNL